MYRWQIFLALFSLVKAADTGSHSLWIMGTYIRGKTPFPEFSVYLMLDDIEFGYYDSNENKAIHRDIHDAPYNIVDAEDIDFASYFENLYDRVKLRSSNVKDYFNHTNDVYVYQRAIGCELLGDDRPGPMYTKDAYNGETVVVDQYDADQDALRINWRWPDIKDKTWIQQINLPLQYRVLYPTCINFLQRHLVKQKNRVLKKVKPRVRLLQKTLPDCGGAKVTCLATGFYPRHINLTLLRDGQPVSDHQIIGGELLPNGDETYQMRKSLEVSAEELQHHHYTCTAEHLSLDNKLDIGLEREWDSGTTIILSSVKAVAVLVCVVGATCAVIIWWWRRRTGQGSQASQSSTYMSAPSADLD
ncbi:major histocompatibility complex class I-related gene protein-like isoform X1 [Alosa sapidissima]|uniref:major histocompatibility complex class I-related gene protein-like isoform X1 n=1 Tax=Alosa sapidissima TaxID=34773 RepID=UPI001C098CED|nr:major histocompatibility complex class I-related gene protein-like isoform X1 [Alosa sapidissima]